MTKLKCPYCNKQIQHAKTVDGNDFYWCENYDCDSSSEMVGTEEMWATVIDAEKKLDIAVNALKRVAANYPRMTDLYRMKIANDTIEQINNKEAK